MSNPCYPLHIRVSIIAGRMRLNMVLTKLMMFPVRNGDTLRLWDEDNESCHDHTLCNVVWDFKESAFVEEIEDDELVPKILDKTVQQEDLLALRDYYAKFGFVKCA